MTIVTGNSKQAAKAWFINYMGYPINPPALLRGDNGLGSLAAILEKQGHSPRIYDCGTVSMMRRLIPEKLAPAREKILETFLDSSSSRRAKGTALVKFLLMEKYLAARRKSVERQLAAEIGDVIDQEGSINLLGFKIWNGPGFSGPRDMAKYLKKRFPRMMIAAGGPHAKFYRGNIFEVTDAFDVIAYGDGEATIAPLAEASLGNRRLEDVPNICFMKNGRPYHTASVMAENISSFPFPDYDPEIYRFFGDMEHPEKEKIKGPLVVEDSRGCSVKCAYCVHPYISGDRTRVKTAARIVDEFVDAANKYEARSFRLAGSSTPFAVLRNVADKIEARNLPYKWTAFVSIGDLEKLTEEELRRMNQKGGLFAVFVGIESGDPEVLSKMTGKTNVNKTEGAIRKLDRAGIKVVGSIIYPAPFDTPESRMRTFAMAKKLPLASVLIQPAGIYPGTGYAGDPEKYNYRMRYPSLLSNFLYWAGMKEKPSYDHPEVFKYLIEYPINLLVPAQLLPLLPWYLNGLDSRRFFKEAQSLRDDFRQAGFLTALPDDMLMMAQMGGYGLKEFEELSLINFFSGHADKVEDMLSRINRCC